MRLNKPYTDDREIEEIKKVLSSGYLTQGPKTEEFEQLVAKLVGCKYAFATSSCTTALHLSLVALGIGPGDEVLVADFTFPATANVVVQQGATPIFVDIDLDTFTMNVEDMRKKINEKTRAIIPVHAFGCSADMNPIIETANKFNIPIIEDAACALGSTYYGVPCGNLGTMGCFSFHPRKVITTGEGGMITTNDDTLAEKIKILRSHGGVREGYWFMYVDAGFNYRLSDIHAAIGIAQMEKLEIIIKRKRELASTLKDLLSDIPEIILPKEPTWSGHIYQSFIIMVSDKVNRDGVITDLRLKNIETTLGTYALHDQPFFQNKYGYTSGQLSNSHFSFVRSITLPLYPQMNGAELKILSSELRQAVLKNHYTSSKRRR